MDTGQDEGSGQGPAPPVDDAAQQDWAQLEPYAPTFAGSPSPQVSRLAGEVEEDWQARQRMLRDHDYDAESRVDESRIMRYEIDWPRLLIYGAFGVALWVLSISVSRWNAALGDPLGEYEGYVRVLMMLAGSLLLFIAWPRYLRRGDTLEQHDAELRRRRRASDDFHRKIRR